MRRHDLSAFVLAFWGFLFSSAVAGQIIFHDQGDTPAISFRYGLLYILTAGVPGAIRGHFPFVISVLSQFIAAALFYWLGRKHARVGWVSAAFFTIAASVWFFIVSPE